MLCMFCGNRQKCWYQISDEALQTEWVKCDYDDYVLDEAIALEELLDESQRRYQEQQKMQQGRNVG